MKILFKKIYNDDRFSLIHRTYNLGMVLSFLASWVLLLLAIISNYDKTFIIYTLFLNISFAILYFASFMLKQFDKVVVVSTSYVILVIIPLMWCIGGGSNNGIHMVIMMIFTGVYVLTPPKAKYYLTASLLAVSIFLQSFEEKFSNFIISYNSSFIEKAVFFVYFITSVFLIMIFINMYYKKIKSINIELIEKNQKLIALRERTENQNEIIKEQLEKLKKADKMKDKFYSIVAHDIKSPFSGILSLSQIIVEKIQNNDKDLMKFAEMLFEGAKKTFHLLLDMLEWTKLQSVGLEFKQEDVNLHPVINEIFDYFRYSASQKNIRLINNTDKKCNIFVDKNMIKTICRNLISNAIKFSENADVSVTSENIDVMCRIKISDTGIGIAESELNRILDTEYYRKGTQGETGTGLGLGLVQEFITRHNSTLQIISEKGKGTDFIFLMPLSDK